MGVIQTIGQGYQIMGQEAKNKIENNRANIFTGISVLGTIATGIVSAFAGAKSARQIDAVTATQGRKLTVWEKAKLCWKNFVIPAGAAIGSSAGAISSRVIDSKDIARLTTDVTLVTRAYNEFKKASNEVLDEKQQQKVKEQIAQKEFEKIDSNKVDRMVEPTDIGRCQLFKDKFSGIVFFSTIDKLELRAAKLREMMADLKPRSREGYSPTVLGVAYSEWLAYNDYFEKGEYANKKDTTFLQYFGWNKGFNDDGYDDDDPIQFTLVPGETMYHGEQRSCYIIIWDVDPSDMRLGNTLKS